MVVLIAAAYMLTQAGRRGKAQRGSCAHSGKVKELRMLGAPQRAKNGWPCACRANLRSLSACLLAELFSLQLINNNCKSNKYAPSPLLHSILSINRSSSYRRTDNRDHRFLIST